MLYFVQTTDRGEFLLAMFWANVLQHELNYPPTKFAYSRQRTSDRDDGQNRDLLQLTVDEDGVTLSVDMWSGVLTAAGKFVYGWFSSTFRRLLENVDARFARDWRFVPTPTGNGNTSPLAFTDDGTQRRPRTGLYMGAAIMWGDNEVVMTIQ